MSPIIGFQESLRPVLPTVLGCKDYQEEKQLLERVDRILKVSGVKAIFLGQSRLSFENRSREAKEAGQKVQVGGGALDRYLRKSSQALRCTVLKALVGGAYREMSCQLAHSPLYRWFCGCEDFEVIKVHGKSTLAEYAHWLPAEEMDKVLSSLTRAVSDECPASIKIGT